MRQFSNSNQETEVYFDGWCFLRTNDAFKKFWCCVKGNELYCKKSPDEPTAEVLHSLPNTFVSGGEPCLHEDQQLYPVKICLCKTRSRVLYFESAELQNQWIEVVKMVAGIRTFEDFYEMNDQLGKGAYGTVNLATHRVSGLQFAVKIVNKAKMNPTEVTQHQRELEILKVCQHPNLVRLIDFFET